MTLKPNRRGLTLLEITLTLALMATLFSMIWGLMSLYSRHYLMGEKRMARAQLVRSISQLLESDLGSAVQDPIHPMRPETSEAVSIRRFGLRGDSTTLAIDVVEPNLFDEIATPAENLAFAVGGGKPQSPQVPELKTVFYEFVPLTAREGEAESALAEELDPAGGSLLIGSLQTPRVGADGTVATVESEVRPFVRKFGLSRRELDFETPGEENAETEEESTDFGTDGSGVVGSLSGPPQSSFAVSRDENNQLLEGLADVTDPLLLPPLTAAQIALDIDDGSMWAPEVVDCRFRYFDGSDWFDAWNSIERNGLPAAIEVSLKLMTLDDVEELRRSPYRDRLSLESEPNTNDDGSGSRLIGTLQTERANQDPLFVGTEKIPLEEAVSLLGLTPVMTRQVVSYLPTTPLAQHQVAERRHPVPTASGNVRRNRTGGPGARTNRAEADRYVENPTTVERRVSERKAQERLAGERTASKRNASERQPLESRVTERTSAPPKAPPRAEERRKAEAPQAPKREAPKREAPKRVERSRTVREEPAAIDDPYAPPSGAPTFDPAFVGVEEPNVGPEPFARSDAAFDSIDALMGGFEPAAGGVPGRVPSSSGPAVPTATKRSAAEKSKTTQTWIRGGRK